MVAVMRWIDRGRIRNNLPTFIVIGAMKAATTSLHKYLKTHPDICMSAVKETNFFTREDHGSKSVEWYYSQFHRRARALGESSTNYTKRHLFPGVPERMHAMLPDAKLIYIVRDPIERALSHAAHSVFKGRLPREALDRIFDPPAGLKPTDREYGFHAPERNYYYLHVSRYHYQLSAYLDYYAMSQILVITTEELRKDRRGTIQRVFAFLGVDPHHDSEELDLIHNTSSGQGERTPDGQLVAKPRLTDEQRARMAAFLKPDIDRFRTLTGRSFPDWSV